jgi:hypothetical protein
MLLYKKQYFKEKELYSKMRYINLNNNPIRIMERSPHKREYNFSPTLEKLFTEKNIKKLDQLYKNKPRYSQKVENM